MIDRLGLIGFMVCCCLVGTGCNSGDRHDPPAAEPPNRQRARITDFELTTSTGKRMRSHELDGKVWVASYFFTRCGSNCRLLNMEMAKLAQEYGPRGVHFVSITCDPQHDTPTALANYADLFNADQRFWTFTTGQLDYLQQIGSDMFEITVSERAHHARITIMDQQSVARGTFDILRPAELKRARNLIEELVQTTSESQVEP